MPKLIPPEDLAAVHMIVAQHPEGVGIEALQKALATTPRRSLQRRLAELVKRGRLLSEGRGRAIRYRIVPPSTAEIVRPEGQPGTPAAAENYVPLSAAGAEVRMLVQRPIAARTPVGYNSAFLDGYIPNTTNYLSEPIRQRLHELGRSPVGERPAGTYARHILNRLLVDLSWASSRLEGNTYTRLDTQNLIEFGMFAAGKDQLEAQMILNHKAAIEMLVENADEIGFNAYTFCNLHALLSDNLLPDPGASGRIRTIPVDITGTVYQPLAIPQQIEEFFRQILAKADAIADPFEQAFFIMAHIPYLQPFEDVNKRVSRLGANISVIRSNLAPLSFVDVPERSYADAVLGVYELNRIELLIDVFTWAYERSCQRYTVLRDALPEPDPLRLRYRTQLRDVVAIIVRNIQPIESETIREHAAALVAEGDLPDFVAMVANELHHLHEGNVARYGLRLSEFTDWKLRTQTSVSRARE
ncbi:Fic family protein [Dokdonella soli]|uniref:Fido domain-containing protein n=1 Tax=Dokdonella soli TaxID=529810 RepID=A0ABP3U4T9_9GAMM